MGYNFIETAPVKEESEQGRPVQRPGTAADPLRIEGTSFSVIAPN